MTRLPDKKPKAGLMTKTADEDFERISRRELERMATLHWGAMRGFWGMLRRAQPSTRARLLHHCLELCHDRGDAPPARLVAWLRRDEKQPRSRVHDPIKMQQAAHYFVDHPQCSLSEVAVAIGMNPENKTTVRDYTRHPEFWRLCNDRLHQRGHRDGVTEDELRKRFQLVQTKIV